MVEGEKRKRKKGKGERLRKREREGGRNLGENHNFTLIRDSGRSTPTVLSNPHGHHLNTPPPFLSPFSLHFSPDKGESPVTVLGLLVT